MSSNLAEVTVFARAITIKIGDKVYEVSWGDEGVMVRSEEKVAVVRQSNLDYFVIIK